MDYSKLTDGEIEELIINKVMLTRPWRAMGYSTDPAAAKEVLKRIGELKLANKFEYHIEVAVGADKIEHIPTIVWFCMNAAPRQICEAALMAMEEKS